MPRTDPDASPDAHPAPGAPPLEEGRLGVRVPLPRGQATAPRTDPVASAAGPAAAPAARPVVRPLRGLLRGCRPRQAVTKNLLVLTAPAIGGHLLTDAAVLPGALVALVAFMAASAAVYLANDVRDLDADRCHPVKRRRPIASGELPVRVAVVASALLATTALGLALWWAPGLAAVLATYLLVQVAYSAHLKHVPGLDMLTVVSGFVLRVVAGGVAAPVELSVPFVTVVGLAALFMVSGKRYSEMRTLGATAGTRRALGRYSTGWLRATWSVAAAATVLAYAVAATGLAPVSSAAGAAALVSLPAFAGGVARYAAHVRRGAAGSPEHVVFGDRVLQVLGVVWVVPMLTAVAVA